MGRWGTTFLVALSAAAGAAAVQRHAARAVAQAQGEVAALRRELSEASRSTAAVAAATGTVAATLPGPRPVQEERAADDLTRIEGIGPKIATLCREAGITTWAALAATPVERLEEILRAAGPRYAVHHPASWPEQAALLASGREDEFAALTSSLRAGRRRVG